jgi:P27 family predicted phage terminase small subunit
MRGRKPETIVSASGTVLDVPRPPSWLSKDAKAEWRSVAAILIERKHLTEADLGTLGAYCDAAGQLAEASRLINAEGLVIATPKGPRRHPATAIQAQARDQLRRLAAELGLTPVSRSRAAIQDGAAGDDLGFLDA